jgi:hypothetical protein
MSKWKQIYFYSEFNPTTVPSGQVSKHELYFVKYTPKQALTFSMHERVFSSFTLGKVQT